MFSASTETYASWITWLLLLGFGLAAVTGILTLVQSRRARYFQVRREAVLRGWGRLLTSVVLLGAALLAMGVGAPLLRMAAEPSLTPPPAAILLAAVTQPPTVDAPATASLTPSDTATSGPTLTPSQTGTPTLSPTPALPMAFVTEILTATVTPPVQASAVNVRFSLRNDCTVPNSEQFFDQLPKQIFAHFYYDSWLPGVEWSGVWTRNGSVIYAETHLWDGSTGGCGYSNYDNGRQWWTVGTYEVQIFVGHSWLVSNRFLIVQSSPTPTITPSFTPLTPTLTPTTIPSRTPSDTPTVLDTATPTPSLAPTTTPSRTPPPPTASPSLTPTVTATIYPPGVTALATIQLPSNITTGVLRATAPDGTVVDFVHTGTPVQVLTGYQLIDGVVWRKVRLANGEEGWIQEFMLKFITPT